MKTATKFQHPLHGANYYVSRDHSEYAPEFNKYHIGEDINTGAGNTDIGEPVKAVANGKVVYAKWAGDSWGNVVITQHTLANGQVVSALYGHLDKVSVKVGDEPDIGKQIGTIGNAGGKYLAHLHLEVYLGAMTAPGAGYSTSADANPSTEWVDPDKFISNFVSPSATTDSKASAKADLQIAKAWLEDSSLSKNQELRVNLHVRNAGQKDAKDTETSFYWSKDVKFDPKVDKLLDTDTHGTLTAGEIDKNEYVEIKYSKLSKLGSGYIIAVIDPSDTVIELIADNNIAPALYFTI